MPTVNAFRGIDARPGSRKGLGWMTDALNCTISGDGLVRRPALRYRVALPAASKGLIAIGNQVCAVAPAGTSLAGLAPDFNLIFIQGGLPLASVQGATVDAAGRPLVLVKNTSGGADLHLAPIPNAAPAGPTVLAPGFTPLAGGLVKAASRSYCLDDGAGSRLLRWSAVDDPAYPGSLGIWSPTADPDNEARRGNFLDLGQHTAAGGKPIGIIDWNGRVAVFFPSAVQVWRVGSSESDRYLEQVINGPGLKRNLAGAPVGQDVVFLGNSLAIHSLRQTSITQGAEPGSPGAPVDDLLQSGLVINDSTTLPFWNEGLTPILLHARARGEVLMALGQDLLVLSWSLGQEAKGWTRWRLPVPVDAMCEKDGVVFIRSGDVGYSLDTTMDQGDEVSAGVYTPIPVMGDMLPVMVSANASVISRVYARCSQDLRIQVVRDGRPARQNDGSLGTLGTTINLPGRGSVPSSVLCAWPCRTFGMRFHVAGARADWRMDEIGFDVRGGRSYGVDP